MPGTARSVAWAQEELVVYLNAAYNDKFEVGRAAGTTYASARRSETTTANIYGSAGALGGGGGRGGGGGSGGMFVCLLQCGTGDGIVTTNSTAATTLSGRRVPKASCTATRRCRCRCSSGAQATPCIQSDSRVARPHARRPWRMADETPSSARWPYRCSGRPSS